VWKRARILVGERTYLTTAFKEKDKVKALGARWDPAAGQWYVPPDLGLAPFGAWLPAGTERREVAVAALDTDIASSSRDLSAQVKGVPLSRLLGGVAAAVAQTFTEGVWTTAEVVRASTSKGHWYLELSERNSEGDVLAQARAVIWARQAQSLLADFKRATGADLDAGIKVLVRARPVFKATFGFSLEVDAIDPSYTLGDLEAQKRDIRERLKREGLFDRNRRLPAPWDYASVLVIAPERAAGLGDFASDAKHLEAHGVCQFSYSYSRFQGEGAAGEIVQALTMGLRTWSGTSMPDALVIIRGGGSVNDLAWLNDYALARCVCECPVPVLTGIGHERDDTSIDEVAHRRFDTPSKVIAGLKDVVHARAREAQALNDFVLSRARAQVAVARTNALRTHEQVQTAARTNIVTARSGTETALSALRLSAVESVHRARGESRGFFDNIRFSTLTELASARQSVPSTFAQIRVQAASNLRHARQDIGTKAPYVLERASGLTQAAKDGTRAVMLDTFDRASGSLEAAAERAQALFREVAGQGPQKTLRRGFAVVRSSAGKTLTTIADVEDGAHIEVSFRDGIVGAVAQAAKPSDPDKS
jgi:exodeoxyribonuclease VII large subunit